MKVTKENFGELLIKSAGQILTGEVKKTKSIVCYDFYDKKRLNPTELYLVVGNIKKSKTFKIDDVTYKITKVFKKKKVEDKCVEIKMVAYKIPNTVTTHAHKCPAKKFEMERMGKESRKQLKEKYGKKTVEAWTKGHVKMKLKNVSSVCPDCKTIFWKEKNEEPEPFLITSLAGKKQLIKRK